MVIYWGRPLEWTTSAPRFPVSKLAFHYAKDVLYFATPHGRSLAFMAFNLRLRAIVCMFIQQESPVVL